MRYTDCVCALCAAPPYNLRERYDSEDLEPFLLDENTSWLADVRLIGENPDCVASGGTYIAYSVEHYDGDHFRVSEPTGDIRIVDVYRWDRSTHLSIPVHSGCLYILAQVLSPRPSDLDMLYKTLRSLWDHWNQFNRALMLDYGSPHRPMSPEWMEETVVFANPPVSNPVFHPLYLSLTRPFDSNARKSIPIGDSTNHKSDIFFRLAPELLLRIMDHLDGPSIGDWRIASRPVARIELTNQFWKMMIQKHMPWIFDLPQLDNDDTNESIDWRKMYQGLHNATHIEHPSAFEPLANRKRIWKTCCQVVRRYDELYKQRPLLASEILTGATSTPVPRLMSPEYYHLAAKAAGLVDTFTELEYKQPTILITWSKDGELAGIDVNHETSEVPESIGHQDQLRIPKDDWLTGFVVTTRKNPLEGLYLEKYTRVIVGIRVLFTIQAPIQYGQSEGDQRLIHVSPGSFAVGLLISSSKKTDKLQRLALIQQPLEIAPTLAQKRLIRNGSETYSPLSAKYLWKGQLPPTELQCFPYDAPCFDFIPTMDYCPVEALIFGRSEEQLSQITALSGDVRLRMFRVEYVDGTSKSIGPRSRAVKSLKIDGPGGERITHFYRTFAVQMPPCVRFVTNYGRQLVLGYPKPFEQRCPPRLLESSDDHEYPLVGIYSTWDSDYSIDPAVNVCTLVAPHVPDYQECDWIQSDGFCWEPAAPPASAVRIGPIYGLTKYFQGGEPMGHRRILASWFNCRRPLQSVMVAACEPHDGNWYTMCSIVFKYADDGEIASIGPDVLTPWDESWADDPMRDANVDVLAINDSDDLRVAKANCEHYCSTTWSVNGSKLKSLRIWYFDMQIFAIQFVSEAGAESPIWGDRNYRRWTFTEIHFSDSVEDHADGIAVFVNGGERQQLPYYMSISAIQAMRLNQ